MRRKLAAMRARGEAASVVGREGAEAGRWPAERHVFSSPWQKVSVIGRLVDVLLMP